MSLCKAVGGPPKNLSASDLDEFIRALEQSKKLYEALSEEAKNALLLEDYPNSFRGNFIAALRAVIRRPFNNHDHANVVRRLV